MPIANERYRILSIECHLNSLLYCAFFLSGVSALVYQIAFERVLVRMVGATVPAVSILLCLFMCGLSLGSLISGRVADRLLRPLAVYGFIEVALAIWAFVFVLITRASAIERIFPIFGADSLRTDSSMLLNGVILYGLISILLLLPTAMMGATLPLLGRYFALEESTLLHGDSVSDQTASTSRNLSKAYSINIGGAALGAICSGFFLLPCWGLTLTIFCGAAVNILAALMIFLVDFVTSRQRVESKLHLASERMLGKKPATITANEPISLNYSRYLNVFAILLAVCASAFLSMMLEVVYTRLFSLVLGSSTYSLSCVIAVFLFGLAAGASLAYRLGLRFKTGVLNITYLFAAFAVIIWASLWLIQELPWMLTVSQIQMAKLTGNLNFSSYLISRVLVVAFVTLLPSVLLGSIFPLSVFSFVKDKENTGAAIAKLSVISALGSALGALSTGYILLPQFGIRFVSGMQATLVGAAMTAMIMSVILMIPYYCAHQVRRKIHLTAITSILLMTGFIYIGALPIWNTMTMSSGVSFLNLPEKIALSRHIFNRTLKDTLDSPSTGSELLFYREGANTTVTVGTVGSTNVTYLKNDGKIEAAVPTDPERPAVHSDLPTQVLLGLLPVVLCPEAPANVYVVGYGSGITCGATLASPEVKTLTVAELEQAIYDSDHFFNHINNEPLAEKNKGRVRTLTADARHVLMTTRRQFQVMISQPAEPWIAGSSSLYTKEFWLLAKSHLTQHGVFCQWIQLYSIDPQYLAVLLRTFRSVFPLSFVFHPNGAGEILIIGFNNYTSRNFESGNHGDTLWRKPVLANDLINIAPVQERMKFPQIYKLLSQIGVVTTEDLMQMIMLSPPAIDRFCQTMALKYHDERLNTDDTLLVEFALPRKLLKPEASISENLKELQRGERRIN